MFMLSCQGVLPVLPYIRRIGLGWGWRAVVLKYCVESADVGTLCGVGDGIVGVMCGAGSGTAGILCGWSMGLWVYCVGTVGILFRTVGKLCVRGVLQHGCVPLNKSMFDRGYICVGVTWNYGSMECCVVLYGGCRHIVHV